MDLKPLKYIFFDYLYNKLIINRKNCAEFIKEFDQTGFVKIKPDITSEITKLNQNIVIDNKEKEGEVFNFKFTDTVKNNIENILKIIEKSHINQLEVFFNTKILPATFA